MLHLYCTCYIQLSNSKEFRTAHCTQHPLAQTGALANHIAYPFTKPPLTSHSFYDRLHSSAFMSHQYPKPYLLVHLHSSALDDLIAQPVVDRVLTPEVLGPLNIRADLVFALPSATCQQLHVVLRVGVQLLGLNARQW